jgi:putative DNA primase/helicase
VTDTRDRLAEKYAIAARRTLTDDGNAYRLVDEHGADLRSVPGAGWHAYEGGRWLHDQSGEPMRRARQLAERLRDEADLRLGEHGADDPLGKAMLQHAKASASRRGLEAMLAIARSDRRVIVDVAELDADPLLLNAPNGTIDLETGRLRGHERGDLITHRVAVDYDRRATAPTWRAFLERVLPEHELRDYAHRMAGAAAIGDNRDELLHVLQGGGANGKSKFGETIRAALGSYAAVAPPEVFLERRAGGPQPELVRLRGARLLTASETEQGARLSVALVKALTGGDTIAARLLHSNEIVEYTPRFSPWLRTNHRPAIRETSEAVWRRVRLVPFSVTIPADERDPTLQGRLLAELGGVLAWIVAGACLYLEHGLDPPDQVVAATTAYREDEDVLRAFVDDRCLVGPDLTAPAGELYTAAQEWAKQHGEKFGTSTAFGRALGEAGFPPGRDARGRRVRVGLALRGPLDDEAAR